MGVNKKAINAYGISSLEHQVQAANPHQLVLMLFDGAIKSINVAKFHIQNGNIAEKGMALTKAIAIVEEGLRVSLDKSVGGDLAENLDALYEYTAYQLLQANIRNDEGILDQVLTLLNDLRSSWQSIDPLVSRSARQHEPTTSESVVYGKV